MTELKSAVVYARYSSDIQNDKSIDDQVGLCELVARREGFKIVEVYSDRAKSGADMFERDGLQAMMKSVKAKPRKFDAVIVECQDRLSRDEEDMAGIYKRLVHNDVELVTQEGVQSSMAVGLRGMVSALFRKDLGDKVRRHHSARAREGKFAGALTYGYRLIPGKPGEREIEQAQARIIVRIFTELDVGKSANKIAKELNSEGVLSPGGGFWNYQSIVGGKFSRRGMIGNQLYVGKLVWNASRGVRDPDTRKRGQLPGRPDELIVTDVPHLRIIPQPLWDHVHALFDSRTSKFGRKGVRRPYKEHLLAGLLRCSECDGNMRIYQSNGPQGSRVACCAARQKGTCTHRKSYYLAGLEKVILEGMKVNLTDPKTLIRYTKAYHARWAERQTEISSERSETETRLNRIAGQIDRYVVALGTTDQAPKAVMEKLGKLEAEHAVLEQRLKGIDEESNVVTLHPATIRQFASDAAALHAGLTGVEEDAVAMAGFRAAFRNVFEKFEVLPTPKRHGYAVTPYFRLAAIMCNTKMFPPNRNMATLLAEQGMTMALSEDESCHRFCHIAAQREQKGWNFRRPWA